MFNNLTINFLDSDEEFCDKYAQYKLKNNKIAYMLFECYSGNKKYNYRYFVSLIITNKRKKIKEWLSNMEYSKLYNQQTNNNLEGLLWAKKCLIIFENEVCYPNSLIIIKGSNERRNKIYKRLEKIGYKYNKIENWFEKHIK